MRSLLGSPAEEVAHLVRPFQFGACMRRARRKRMHSPGARSNHHTPHTTHTTHTTPRSKWLLPCPLDFSGWFVLLGPNICPLVCTGQRVPPLLVSVWMHSALVSSWPRNLFPWQTPMRFSTYLMLLTSVDVPFTLFGVRFRQIKGYLGCRPNEILWVCRLLNLAAAGRPGLGAVHLLFESAGELGVAWNSTDEGWLRPLLDCEGTKQLLST